MKIAYIMRGVPGSGKSTLAKVLAGTIGIVHSTDKHFYVGNEYRFDPSQLNRYHGYNFDAFRYSLAAGTPVVICDNTNVRRWHFEHYAEAATAAGYIVAYVVMPHPDPQLAAARNVHNVPADTIKRMITEWED